ncbi:unnamed protein product [Oreochromis niloticus]|nr:unnamed protein product [Mustela putorius furo]
MAQQWTVGEVSLWLGENELADYQQVFIYHESECGFFIVCGLEDCPRKFLSVKSLKNHIRKKHKYQKQGLESAPDCDPVIQETVEFPQSSERALSELIENFTETVRKQLALFSLNLQEKSIVNRKVQTFVLSEVESLFKYFIENYREIFTKCLQTLNFDISSFHYIDDNSLVEHCFSAVSNTYQLDRYCVEKLNLIEPDINPLDDGEDERSTDQHVSVIKQECQKTRPNVDVIRMHLRKIQKYRTHYILQHTTEEVLREFPCLTIPVVLLEEASMLLKTDVDKKVIRGFSKLAAKLVSIAPNSNLKSLCLKSVDESQIDTERKGRIVNTAVLLLPSIFKENASHLFVVNKDPHSSIPTIVLSSSDGKPLSDSTEVNVQMDGQKMILDSGEMDISLAMGIVFSLYHVYNVAYPSELKKTFCFLEAFVLNLGTLTTPVPVAVQRVANALNIS